MSTVAPGTGIQSDSSHVSTSARAIGGNAASPASCTPGPRACSDWLECSDWRALASLLWANENSESTSPPLR
eukprot:1179378-Prorocentrum_minimum.AAC.1